MLAAAVLSTVGAPAAMLRGSYPDFAAPLYHASASVCDAMAAPCAAAGDGTTLDTAALQACIDHCPRAPDGSFAVVLRSGRRFLSGSLNLTSGCHLVIDGVLLGSTDPADYPVVPPLPGYGPGQRDIALHGWGRHQALLSGWNMSDVVVSGRGIIDGQGLVVDPKLKSSWVSRLRSYISCKKSKGGCAGKPSASLLDFGRPRVWEPMFSSRLALVNLTVTNQVPSLTLGHPTRLPHRTRLALTSAPLAPGLLGRAPIRVRRRLHWARQCQCPARRGHPQRRRHRTQHFLRCHVPR